MFICYFTQDTFFFWVRSLNQKQTVHSFMVIYLRLDRKTTRSMKHSSIKWLGSHFCRYFFYAWVELLWKSHLFLLALPRQGEADTFPFISTLLKMHEQALFYAQTLDQDKSEALFNNLSGDFISLPPLVRKPLTPQLWLVWGILG